MKVSIITINYNNIDGLRKTVESVVCQTYHDFEYIIVDGASTDGGAEYVKELEKNEYPFVFKWVSEKDTGIYNAMNKGISMAHGEYVLMLNSGDFLINQFVIERVMPELEGTDIIQGNTISQIDGKLWRNRGYGKSDISFLDVQRGHFLHQASFCKLYLFNQFGFFREDYKYVSDTIFFIKALGLGGASFRYVDIDIANFDTTGFSSSRNPAIYTAYQEEEQRMQRELFPGRLYAYCRDSERKVELFDALRKHSWLWNGLIVLKLFHNMIYGEPHVPISEEI